MNDDPRHTDDISQLWGAQDYGVLEPAAPWRPAAEAGPAPDGPQNENGQVDRVATLEGDVRALLDMVERLETVVNERLDRLEQQVAEFVANGRRKADEQAGGRHAVQKGVSRLSEVLRSTRNR